MMEGGKKPRLSEELCRRVMGVRRVESVSADGGEGQDSRFPQRDQNRNRMRHADKAKQEQI